MLWWLLSSLLICVTGHSVAGAKPAIAISKISESSGGCRFKVLFIFVSLSFGLVRSAPWWPAFRRRTFRVAFGIAWKSAVYELAFVVPSVTVRVFVFNGTKIFQRESHTSSRFPDSLNIVAKQV